MKHGVFSDHLNLNQLPLFCLTFYIHNGSTFWLSQSARGVIRRGGDTGGRRSRPHFGADRLPLLLAQRLDELPERLAGLDGRSNQINKVI